jgi:hypothetical protein
MRHIVGVVLCCLLGIVSATQNTALTTEKDARALAEATLERVIAGEYEAAFDDLRPVWPFSSSELDALLSTTVNQRATVTARFGESLGYEFVRREAVSGSLLRLTYMELTERHVLRWVFLFYKPGDTWTLNSIEWDDSVDALFGK